MPDINPTLELTLLILAALLPAGFLMVRTWMDDAHEKEPKSVVIATVIMGLALPLVVYWPERLMSDFIGLINLPRTATGVLNAFFVAGLIEEFGKFAVFMALIYRNENFNEPFDGIIYAVAISLGFAAFENVLYVLLSWMSVDARTAWSVVQSRTLLALPQHAFCGLFMGYYLGKARFREDRIQRHRLIAVAFLVAFGLHGLYDSLLELFGDYGVLPCLGLLGCEYFVARKVMTTLLNDSPFLSVSKVQTARRIRHHHLREKVPLLPRSGWPWER